MHPLFDCPVRPRASARGFHRARRGQATQSANRRVGMTGRVAILGDVGAQGVEHGSPAEMKAQFTLTATPRELDVRGGRRAPQEQDPPRHLQEDQIQQPRRPCGDHPTTGKRRSPLVSGVWRVWNPGAVHLITVVSGLPTFDQVILDPPDGRKGSTRQFHPGRLPGPGASGRGGAAAGLERGVVRARSERYDPVALGEEPRHVGGSDERPADLLQIILGRPTGHGAAPSNMHGNRVLAQLGQQLTSRRYTDPLHAGSHRRAARWHRHRARPLSPGRARSYRWPPGAAGGKPAWRRTLRR